MIFRTLSPLTFALLILLAAPLADAWDKPKPKPKPLDTRSSMAFEMLGAYEGYELAPVPLPMRFYANAAGDLRRDFLPKAGTSGHSLRGVRAKQADLIAKIRERHLQGRSNNPHAQAAWENRLRIWKKVEQEILKRLDQAVRAAVKRDETTLVEHGVRSFATLVAEGQAAQAYLKRRGLLGAQNQADEPGASIAIRSRQAFLRVAIRDVAARAAPSFTGRWHRKDSTWGVVALKMTSQRTLTGTWDGGKRGRTLKGVLLDDGVTMRLTYWDDGKPQPTKYKARLSEDGKMLSIWWSYLDNQNLDRQ